ncbi:MAG: hypothetical protein R2873_20405 [Caldilineaceae bacterium]
MDHIAELDRLRDQLRSPADSAANRTVDDIRGTLLSYRRPVIAEIPAGHRQSCSWPKSVGQVDAMQGDRSV